MGKSTKDLTPPDSVVDPVGPVADPPPTDTPDDTPDDTPGAAAEMPIPEVRNANTHIGLDTTGSGVYSYAPLPEGFSPRERRIVVAGMNFEHVAEDVDGVWLYRSM